MGLGGHSFEEDSDHYEIQVLDAKNGSWEGIPFSSHGVLYFGGAVLDIPECHFKAN